MKVFNRAKFKGTTGLLLGVCFVFPMDALGAGYWNLSQGLSIYGRGGAAITTAFDPTTLQINPANLAGLLGLQFIVGSDMILDLRYVDRADNPKGEGFAEITLERADNIIPWVRPPSPHVFLSYNLSALNLPELSVGLGVWGPPRSDQVFEKPNKGEVPKGAQRYSAVRNENAQIHTGMGISYELPWSKLKIGGSLIFIQEIIDLGMSLGTYAPFWDKQDPDYDAYANLTAEALWIPNFNFGFSMEVTEWLRVAGSFQSHFDVNASGKIHVTFGRGLDGYGAELIGDEITLLAKLPAVVRLGIAYFETQRNFDIELAFTWEGWGRNDYVELTPVDSKIAVSEDLAPLLEGKTRFDLANIRINNYFRDTYSVRLGSSWWPVEDIVQLHHGIYFEASAVPSEWLTTASLDLPKMGVTSGFRWFILGGMHFDTTFGYSYWFEKTVTNSKYELSNTLAGAGFDATVGTIGNGSYGNTQLYLLLALGGKFNI